MTDAFSLNLQITPFDLGEGWCLQNIHEERRQKSYTVEIIMFCLQYIEAVAPMWYKRCQHTQSLTVKSLTFAEIDTSPQVVKVCLPDFHIIRSLNETCIQRLLKNICVQ